MHISIQHDNSKYPSFSVMLHSAKDKDPFLTIKNCRIVQGQKGDFVSWPAKKLDSGKYFNYCYASEAFNEAVLRAALDTPKEQSKRAQPDADEIPF